MSPFIIADVYTHYILSGHIVMPMDGILSMKRPHLLEDAALLGEGGRRWKTTVGRHALYVQLAACRKRGRAEKETHVTEV